MTQEEIEYLVNRQLLNINMIIKPIFKIQSKSKSRDFKRLQEIIAKGE